MFVDEFEKHDTTGVFELQLVLLQHATRLELEHEGELLNQIKIIFYIDFELIVEFEYQNQDLITAPLEMFVLELKK